MTYDEPFRHVDPGDSEDMVGDIWSFHAKFDLLYQGKPRQLPEDILMFRLQFLREELNEYETAANRLHASLARGLEDDAEVTHLLELQLDALVDLVYVALGTAHLHGFDFNEAWSRVHRANMAKVRAQSADESKRGSTYDVVKPKGWEPPSHTDLVEDHIHRESLRDNTV